MDKTKQQQKNQARLRFRDENGSLMVKDLRLDKAQHIVFTDNSDERIKHLSPFRVDDTRVDLGFEHLCFTEDAASKTLYISSKSGKFELPGLCDRMFEGLKNLQDIEGLGRLDVSRSEDMFCMFRNCSSLKELDLSAWDTGYVYDMRQMFEGCSSLEKVDLSSASCESDLKTDDMFKGCDSLKQVSLPKGPLAARAIKREAGATIGRNDPERVLS